MSSFEDKVSAVTDFLRNRASLQRLTSHEEVGNVAGKLLRARQQRHIDTPVIREKIIEVLAEVDRKSFKKQGFLLSALVTHFFDNNVGHRFYERAIATGLLSTYADEEARRVFHRNHVKKIYAHYEGMAAMPLSVEVPDNISELDDVSEDSDSY